MAEARKGAGRPQGAPAQPGLGGEAPKTVRRTACPAGGWRPAETRILACNPGGGVVECP